MKIEWLIDHVISVRLPSIAEKRSFWDCFYFDVLAVVRGRHFVTWKPHLEPEKPYIRPFAENTVVDVQCSNYCISHQSRKRSCLAIVTSFWPSWTTFVVGEALCGL